MNKKNKTKDVTLDKKINMFLQLKMNFENECIYVQEKHCKEAIEILGDKDRGTYADICKAFVITESEFNEWRKKYTLFNKAVEFGQVLAKVNWQNEPREHKELDDDGESKPFNFSVWKYVGKCRFGISDQAKIKVELDKTLSPVEQYGQLLDCAAMGYYSASEFKQVSEAINIGIRAHEVCNMQSELNELRQTLIDIQQRNAADGFNLTAD